MTEIADGMDLTAVAQMIVEEPDDSIQKAVILKPYDERTQERGVVFVSFEYQWARLLDARNMKEFARRYQLVVSPTWTPPHSPFNVLFPRIWPEPVYCLISNKTDLETFPRICENYRMVDLFASSWVDPSLFHPKSRGERCIDLVMLANFGTYKRHHALFRALRRLPKDWKIVLVGQPNGTRTAETLLAEADAFGVRNQFELRQRVTDEEVCNLLASAHISLICSKREGSCVAVVESMFADTPVGLLQGAGIGSGAFINSSTGAFLDESRLAAELIRFHKEAEMMTPRRWCLDNGIDAHSSSGRLNEFLRLDSIRDGRVWTRDITPFHWRPDPVPFPEGGSDWREREQKLIEANFGIRFPLPRY